MKSLLTALVLALPLCLWAQSQAPSPSAEGGTSPAVAEKFRRVQNDIQAGGSGGGDAAVSEARSLPLLALEVGTALFFVLGAAVVTIRLLRRAQRGMQKRSHAGGDLLEIVETCHLGPGQKLVAVRLDGKISVMGVTRENISLVSELERPAEEILAERRRQGNPALFSENLNKMLVRFKKPKKVSEYPTA